MLRTYHKTNPEEFELIRTPKHIGEVTKKMNIGLDRYFEKLLSGPKLGIANQLSTKFKVVSKAPAPRTVLETFFNAAVLQCKKHPEAYLLLFQAEHMESYRENASHFRSRLVKKCPIINKTLKSDREELH